MVFVLCRLMRFVKHAVRQNRCLVRSILKTTLTKEGSARFFCVTRKARQQEVVRNAGTDPAADLRQQEETGALSPRSLYQKNKIAREQLSLQLLMHLNGEQMASIKASAFAVDWDLNGSFYSRPVCVNTRRVHLVQWSVACRVDWCTRLNRNPVVLLLCRVYTAATRAHSGSWRPKQGTVCDNKVYVCTDSMPVTHADINTLEGSTLFVFKRLRWNLSIFVEAPLTAVASCRFSFI